MTASNRVAMVYRLDARPRAGRRIAERMLESPAAELAMFAEDGWLVVRRGGGELRFRRGPGEADARGNRVHRRRATPTCCTRSCTRTRSSGSRGCSLCPAAGDVIVSAAPGYEFADSGGAHHAGGGSHGSLRAEDSIVPLITAGFAQRPGLRRRSRRSPTWLRSPGATSASPVPVRPAASALARVG